MFEEERERKGWHWAVVCPGTTTGRHSTPAFSPVPVDPQADCHSTHTLTQDEVMRVFGFCIHEAPEIVGGFFFLHLAFTRWALVFRSVYEVKVSKMLII